MPSADRLSLTKTLSVKRHLDSPARSAPKSQHIEFVLKMAACFCFNYLTVLFGLFFVASYAIWPAYSVAMRGAICFCLEKNAL